MLSLTIGGIERKNNVQAYSLNIQKTISKKRNNCSFTIVSEREALYKPNMGEEVIVTDGAIKIFAGVIISIESSPMGNNLVSHKVECQDYSRLFDRRLVPDSFTNKTVDEIIALLKVEYFPADITITNVNCPVLISTARFNYKQLYDVIEDLAKRTNYDWYIDYDKDLHFFERESVLAPFTITDNDGSYLKDTLKIRSDNTQLRNTIIVRGGEYDGSSFTTEIEADGVSSVFNLPYRYTDFRATITTDDLSLGTDYIDEPSLYDALYNYNEKLLRFQDADKPLAGVILRVSGKPKLPVIVRYTSSLSIASTVSSEGGDGIYEYLIIDKNINSKEEARERARIEVNTFGESLIEASFSTNQSGLEAGQKITINSDLMQVNESYIIQSVRVTQRTQDTFTYNVNLISQKSFDVVDILKNLIMKDTEKIEIAVNEVVDIVRNLEDTISLSDSSTLTTSGNGVYKWQPDASIAKWNFSTWQ